jgi:hypothetical protein
MNAQQLRAWNLVKELRPFDQSNYGANLRDALFAIIKAIPEEENRDSTWHNLETVNNYHWVGEEDLRKLRIIKAMERMCLEADKDGRDKIEFTMEMGAWVCRTSFGSQKINEYYCPAK